VKLCGDSLRRAGRRVALGGNYGPPLCDVVRSGAVLDWVVVEVSSFQLEKATEFRPRVGVLLNVHPNHLDRHHGMDEYVSVKARLFARMGAGDLAVVFDQNVAEVRQAAGQGRSEPWLNRWVTFGLSSAAEYHYYESRVHFQGPSMAPGCVAFEGTRFADDVMGITAAAAVAAIAGCGVDPRVVAQAAMEFDPLPHRMQEVARIRGVRFIDDSKATTLSALEAGVRMAGGKVRLIAGGLLKESELGFIKQTLEKKVRAVYLIGKSTGVLAEAWGDAVTCCRCGTLDQAVRKAWKDAAAGDTVLLSPGCASFDQFTGYEERGNQFAGIVRSFDEKR